MIRPARPGEAALLSDLALRSKGHWGYDAAFLASCREELELGEAELAVRRTCVAEVGGAVLGFGTVEGAPPVGEIGMLFVDPDAIGQGIGRALLTHLVDRAAVTGFARLRIEADPYAEAFYLAQGAVRVGEIASGSVPGRVLPLLELDVDGRVHGLPVTDTPVADYSRPEWPGQEHP